MKKQVKARIDLDVQVSKDVTTKIKAGAIIPADLVDLVPEIFKVVEDAKVEGTTVVEPAVTKVETTNEDETAKEDTADVTDSSTNEDARTPEEIVGAMDDDAVLTAAKEENIEVAMQTSNPEKPTKKGLVEARAALIEVLKNK